MGTRALTFEAYNSLVADIYAAGDDTRAWQDVLDTMSRLLDGTHIVMHAHDSLARDYLGSMASGFDPHFIGTFQHHYGTVSPFARPQSQSRIGGVQSIDSMIERRDLLKTEFHADWLRPQGDISAGGGVTVTKTENKLLRLSVHLPYRDADRRQRDVLEAVGLIAPHLGRAFEAGRQLNRSRTSGPIATSVLDNVPDAVFLLDRQGRAVYANRAAEEACRSGEVVTMSRAGAPAMADPHANISLARAMRDIAAGDFSSFDGVFTAVSATGPSGARVSVVPVGMRDDSVSAVLGWRDERAAVAILNIRLPSAGSPDAASLGRAYGLTRAEAALALSLLDGRSLGEHADDAGVSVATVRNQLKSIFRKVGVGRQSELVALLARNWL